MDFNNLSLYKPKMEYRRFGKTEKEISVITLGGMRFKHVWDKPRDVVPQESIDELTDTVKKAFKQGINHIETAYGYTKSEHAFGIVLNDVLNIPRESYFLMTKGNPKTAEETRRLFEDQLKALKTDYIDFYAWHGINCQEDLDIACAPGGPIDTLYELKAEGKIKHIGFSTHAPLEVILKTINTDKFEFINLHYYYFFQRNKPAVDMAAAKDMGIFIISPCDKGGMLNTPPEKLSSFTAPLSPLQWNARFCLGNSAIHTLTFGLPETVSFDQLNGIFPAKAPLDELSSNILKRMDEEMSKVPHANFDGYAMAADPSGLNIPEILRYRKMWKAFDMEAFGIYRYNTMKVGNTWLPGDFPTKENLKLMDLSKCPNDIPLEALIMETHNALYKPKSKEEAN